MEDLDQIVEVGGGILDFAFVAQGAHGSLIADGFKQPGIFPDVIQARR